MSILRIGKGEGSGEGWGEGEGKGQGNGGTWKGELCTSCTKSKINSIHRTLDMQISFKKYVQNVIKLIIQIYDKFFYRRPWKLSSSTWKFLYRFKNRQPGIRRIHWIH